MLLKRLNGLIFLYNLGDGVESQSVQESPKMSSSIVIPDDFESQNEMVRRGKKCFRCFEMNYLQ